MDLERGRRFMTFKLIKDENPRESGLYQVNDTYMGWSLAYWDDGEWSFIPKTSSTEDCAGYYRDYNVTSWNYLHIPRPIDGKSSSSSQDL